MNDLIYILYRSDYKQLLYFIVAFVIITYVFRSRQLSIASLVIFIVWYQYVWFSHKRTDESQSSTEKHTKLKQESIRPQPVLAKKYDDVTDFLFYIQDMYKYNPQSFEELVDAIDSFLETYEQIRINNRMSNLLYKQLDDKRRNALNILHSFVYNLVNDPNMNAKHVESLKRLDKLLITYQEQIKYIHEKYNYETGLTTEYTPIHEQPYAANVFDKRVSFEYY